MEKEREMRNRENEGRERGRYIKYENKKILFRFTIVLQYCHKFVIVL